jgi:hypothetical protein
MCGGVRMSVVGKLIGIIEDDYKQLKMVSDSILVILPHDTESRCHAHYLDSSTDYRKQFEDEMKEIFGRSASIKAFKDLELSPDLMDLVESFKSSDAQVERILEDGSCVDSSHVELKQFGESVTACLNIRSFQRGKTYEESNALHIISTRRTDVRRFLDETKLQKELFVRSFYDALMKMILNSFDDFLNVLLLGNPGIGKSTF